MHKMHHHYVLPYTDSNYGNIFSIWDRLLGTYMYLDPEKIVYGVDVFSDEKEKTAQCEVFSNNLFSHTESQLLVDKIFFSDV